MGNIEEKIQELVLLKYNSIREFTQTIGMPNSTFVSIMRRGVDNSSVTNVIQICKALGIKADAVAAGRIEYVDAIADENDPEQVAHLNIIFRELTEEDKKKVEEYAKLLAMAHKP